MEGKRNSELHPARSAMREVEDRFNKRFGYPWVFVNDEPFTDEYGTTGDVTKL